MPTNTSRRWAQHKRDSSHARVLPQFVLPKVSPALDPVNRAVLRRIESSPPRLIGSPPFLARDANLSVRKRRRIDSANSEGSIASVVDISSGLTLGRKQHLSRTESDAYSRQSFYQGDDSSAQANTQGPNASEFRAPGKRGMFAKMIDDAKTMYPRFSQRNFSSGLLRRASTKSDITSGLQLKPSHSGPFVSSAVGFADRSSMESASGSTLLNPLPSPTLPSRPGLAQKLEVLPAPVSSSSDKSLPYPGPLSVNLVLYPDVEGLPRSTERSFRVIVTAEAGVFQPPALALNQNGLSSPGLIGNVRLIIEALPGYAVEAMFGGLCRESLGDNEVMTVSVQVRAETQTPSRPITSSSDDPALDNAFNDLEEYLGETLSPCLSVKCQYTHTFFPPTSRITTREVCYLSRTQYSADDHTMENTEHAEEAHARLIYGMAAQMSPREALKTFDKVFTSECPCACPEYLDVIECMLTDQIVADDNALRSGLPAASIRDSVPTLPRFTFEWRQSQMCTLNEQIAALKLDQGLPTTQTYAPGSTRPPLAPLQINRDWAQRSSPGEGDDKARNIWRHMRHTSRGSSFGVPSESEPLSPTQSREANGRLWEIRKEALRNKRSVGAETLASLAEGARGLGGGM